MLLNCTAVHDIMIRNLYTRERICGPIMNRQAVYETLGISKAVYEMGEAALEKLRHRFEEIDSVAE